MQPGRPVQPMLASPAADVADALAATGPASVEWKLDGARVQVHRRDGEVRLYTRNLNDITDRLGRRRRRWSARCPAATSCSTARRSASTTTARPRRFQDTMGDFGADAAEPDAGAACRRTSSTCCTLDGAATVDEPLTVRRELLSTIVPAAARLPSIVTADVDEADGVPRPTPSPPGTRA